MISIDSSTRSDFTLDFHVWDCTEIKKNLTIAQEMLPIVVEESEILNFSTSFFLSFINWTFTTDTEVRDPNCVDSIEHTDLLFPDHMNYFVYPNGLYAFTTNHLAQELLYWKKPFPTTPGDCWNKYDNWTYYIRGTGGEVLAEYEANTVNWTNPVPAVPSLKRQYIYANGNRIAMIDENGNTYFYINDHLGSARVVLTSTGAVRDKLLYSAFGGAENGQQIVTGQPHRYTGKPLDEELDLGLYYYGSRYYDAELGRFTAVDPLRDKNPNHSAYIYTANNPLRFIDPNGLDWFQYEDQSFQWYDNDFVGPRQGDWFSSNLYYNYDNATLNGDGSFSFSSLRIDPDIQSFIPYGDNDYARVKENVSWKFNLLSYMPFNPFLLFNKYTLYGLNVGEYSQVDLKRNSSTVFDQRLEDGSFNRLGSFVYLHGEIVKTWDGGNKLAGEMASLAGIPFRSAAFGAGIVDILSKRVKREQPFSSFSNGVYGDELTDYYFNRRGYYFGN